VSNAPKSSLRDHLTTTTDQNKIELTEQELSRVSGGADSKCATTGSILACHDSHGGTSLTWPGSVDGVEGTWYMSSNSILGWTPKG
jgi:hypothetical protein